MRDGGGVDELAPLYLVLCHLDYFLEIREHAPRLCERRRRVPPGAVPRLPIAPFRERGGGAWGLGSRTAGSQVEPPDAVFLNHTAAQPHVFSSSGLLYQV